MNFSNLFINKYYTIEITTSISKKKVLKNHYLILGLLI